MKCKQMFSWPGFITLGVVLGFCVGSLVNHFSVNAQSPYDKNVIKLADTLNPQVKFGDLKVGEEDRTAGEVFDADPEWVKDLSFDVTNIAGKKIIFLQVNVNFPETRTTGNLMSYTMFFGEMPGRKFKGSKRITLQPGEHVEISLGPEIEKISKFLKERQSIESVKAVELEVGFIVFDDNTGWSAGSFLQKDGDVPGRYKPVLNGPEH